MTISRLAVTYRGRLLLPVLGPVTSTGYTDRLHVRLVSGQSADDFARPRRQPRARVRRPGLPHPHRRSPARWWWSWSAVTPSPRSSRPCPSPATPTCGPCRSAGRKTAPPWAIRLHGTHVLLAGSTGAGKASVLWGIIRGLLPALADGTVRILGADPKLMELAYGRPLFDRYGRYESDPAAITVMLEDAVTGMQQRAARTRRAAARPPAHHREHPFTVIFVDEVAFLTAYQPDRKLRERTLAAIATLTTQGRAVGYCVVAALQDPRKDVLTIRNLFPDRIAMRLDEPEQVDMVLGDGARDRGATADLISADPATGAGIAYVRLESDPDPVRVRAAWVSDDDITAMCRQYAPAACRGCQSRQARGMTGPTMWRTDDPCPVCGTGLTATDDTGRPDQTGQDCALCGWSVTWQAALDLDPEGITMGHSHHPDGAHTHGTNSSNVLARPRPGARRRHRPRCRRHRHPAIGCCTS